MKRFIAAIIAISLMCCSVFAENNFGISTAEFLSMFDAYLQPFGLPYWSLELEEDEKEDSSITKLITDKISLVVYQEAGIVTEFWIVTDLGNKSNQGQIESLIYSIMGAFMITDLEISANDALTYANQVVEGEILTRNGITYYYTSNPFVSTVAFKAIIANPEQAKD